jgi:hypothetical protein
MIPPSETSSTLPSVVTPSGTHRLDDTLMDLYAVQKCWYSGPHVAPTVDYLRLLRTPREAEQIAYHSAHLLAQQSGAGAVRTIALPAHPSQHAFVAAGLVFWVRRVRALVVATSTMGHNDAAWDHAHCIVSHGILGGSGGSVRRRETADAPLRIFVGPQSAHRALQLICGGGAVPAGSTVQWVPVGAPPTVQHIPNEWPSAHQKEEEDGLVMDAEETMSHHDKRTLEENPMNTVWYSSNNPRNPSALVSAPPPKNTDPFVAWHPPSPTWESRPHKRPCRSVVAAASSWYPSPMMESDVTNPHHAMME